MFATKCKVCRRLGVKFCLKNEKCASVKRPYPPGLRAKKVRPSTSEYGHQLVEKQKLRYWYGLREKQFSNYIKKALEHRGGGEDAGSLLIRMLEKRLDNVIFRLGLGKTRFQARQSVTHGHFLIRGKRINVPSYQVKKGDVISIREGSKNKQIFKNAAATMKKTKIPSWLEADLEKIEVKVVGEPVFDEAQPPAEISTIFEYYSR